MSGAVLRIGSEVIDPDGVRCVVLALRAGSADDVATVDLREVDTGRRVHVASSDVARHWSAVDVPHRVLPTPDSMMDVVPDSQRQHVADLIGHLREVETGIRPDDPEAAPRRQYDPSTTCLAERERAKAEELSAAGQKVSLGSIRRWRQRLRDQGPWGLVDKRAARVTDPLAGADPELLGAIRTELGQVVDGSTITKQAVITKALRRVGAGVEVPSRATLFRYVDALSSGGHHFGEATTRRTNRMPEGMWTESVATRPGEWVQADTTRLDVLAIYPGGSVGAVELTIALDIATRSIVAWRLTPVGTNAVDITSLIAQCMTPEPMRPGWLDRVAATHPSSPVAILADIDERIATAAARPIVVPEVFAVDNGKQYLSTVTLSTCERLGISVQPARPYTGSDKAVVERTFQSINTLFCEFLAGHKGRNTAHRGRHPEIMADLTVDELADLFGWWVVAHWQRRTHEGLRNPAMPGIAHTPNQMYAAAMQVSGHVPLPLGQRDYIALLPSRCRTIRRDGIQIDHRMYDAPALGPYRGRESGLTAANNKWVVHYDPSDLTRVWMYDHTTDDFHEIPWTYAARIGKPFTQALWRHAWAATVADPHKEATEYSAVEVLDELLAGNSRDPRERRALARAQQRASLAAVPRHEGGTPTEDDDEDEVPDDAFAMFDTDKAMEFT